MPFTLIGDVNGDHRFQIYAHKDAEKYVGNYITSMFQLNAMTEVDTTNWYDFHGLSKNDVFRLTAKKTKLEIEVFECDHAIPTISYGLSEIKKKLKDEYIGLPGKEIAQLRKNGVEINTEVVQNKLAYICDTSINVFEMNSTILNYDVIFIECTFYMDDELDNAVTTKHIHWEHLKPIVVSNSDKLFVLFHFSQRYRDSEISDFFQTQVDSGITNIKWWITDE